MLVLDSSYDSKYGNFLYNCEKSRVQNEIHLKTESLWHYVHTNRDRFTEKIYRRNSSVLNISTSLKKIQLWNDYYLR